MTLLNSAIIAVDTDASTMRAFRLVLGESTSDYDAMSSRLHYIQAGRARDRAKIAPQTTPNRTPAAIGRLPLPPLLLLSRPPHLGHPVAHTSVMPALGKEWCWVRLPSRRSCGGGPWGRRRGAFRRSRPVHASQLRTHQSSSSGPVAASCARMCSVYTLASRERAGRVELAPQVLQDVLDGRRLIHPPASTSQSILGRPRLDPRPTPSRTHTGPKGTPKSTPDRREIRLGHFDRGWAS